MTQNNRETNITILPIRNDRDVDVICQCECPCLSSRYPSWKSGKTQTFGLDLTASVIRRNGNIAPQKLDRGNFYGQRGVRAYCVTGTQFVTAETYKLEQNDNIITIPEETLITIGPSVERNVDVPNGTICNSVGEFVHETMGTKITSADNFTLEVGTIVSIDRNTRISFSIPYFDGKLICQNINLPFEFICITS